MAIQLINLDYWLQQINAQCPLYIEAIWTIEDDDRDISSVATPAAFVYLRDCRIELLNALVGWIPADCITQIEHVSGEATKFDDKKFIWTDIFRTDFYLRKL
jgi:hypothetical protein